MSGAIQAAAAEISRLYADIYRWLPERDKSEEGRRQWTEACGRFHHAYPKLAFPGGLARMYAEMPRGHSAVLEDAIRFFPTSSDQAISREIFSATWPGPLSTRIRRPGFEMLYWPVSAAPRGENSVAIAG
jgi:hypothetical protein